ncbi:glycosyltransferase family 2 protein [Dongia deserti]|uniref:glycosyltransferase family 2 protein n=1 Tax=Dongia deserti TaxID=2268030 RepID=UPI000E64AB36|nr:glycosyltransferase family 2 protein [Dongia deserti]
MAKIFAVIVTFNRAELLRRCLSCVFAQSRHCDRVIVIDNCSSDGTSEMLRREWADRVEVHTLPDNLGAAGGFNAGIRIAYQRGADFVWVMDDDVLPSQDALAKLIEADQFLANSGIAPAFVLSAAWAEDGSPINVPKINTRPGASGYESWPRFLDRKIVPVTRATFVSILLPRAVIQEYGLPLAQMFIWGEDSEYTLRITDQRPGFLVAESRVLHLRQLSGAVNIMTESNGTRLKYHRHLIRNHMYVARRYTPRLEYYRHAIRQAQLVLRLMKAREFGRAGIVLTGIFESFWFNPSIERADALPSRTDATILSSRPVIEDAENGDPKPQRLAGSRTPEGRAT